MKTLVVISLIYLSLLGCEHPEGRNYERNQGKYRQLDQEKNETQINSVETSIPDNKWVASKNVLIMEIENGVRYVWIEINGLKLRFIFDTGANSICISSAEATVLYRQGTLRKEDVFDVEYFQDATGRISEGTKINLREVKIGNKVLEDVKATVVDNINAPLLLGQTVLERFGRIEIDNENREIIFK